MGRGPEDGIVALRLEAERALRLGRPSDSTAQLLEQLAACARPGSDEAAFAHRALGELLLERSPWRAALHLRRAQGMRPDDDVALALAGLAHALLGHLRMAVASFRRAVERAPQNPWYCHNLGHLLDAGLRRPADGLALLERAHALEPDEDEICGSLAHCLAALGRIEQARELVGRAIRLNPDSAEHHELDAWLRAGAPASHEPARPVLAGRGTAARARSGSGSRIDPVEALLVSTMSEASFRIDAIARARAIWRAYARTAKRRTGRAAVYAAAVELALVRSEGRDPSTLASVAHRYGVDARAVERRADQIAIALRSLRG